MVADEQYLYTSENMWMKQFDCPAGNQEVSRCRTRGESEESIHAGNEVRIAERIRPGCETQVKCYQKSKTFPHKKDICVMAVSSPCLETSVIPVGYQ